MSSESLQLRLVLLKRYRFLAVLANDLHLTYDACSHVGLAPNHHSRAYRSMSEPQSRSPRTDGCLVREMEGRRSCTGKPHRIAGR
jgi:hypothetical protein